MSSHYDINVVKIQDEQNTAYLLDFSPVLKPIEPWKKTSSDWSFFSGGIPKHAEFHVPNRTRWDGAILYGSVSILGILQVEINVFDGFRIFPANIHGTAELTMVKGC